MMTIFNSPLTRRAKRGGPWRLVLLVCVVLLLVTLVSWWRAPLSGALWSLLAPVLQARFGGDIAGLQGELVRAEAALADRDALYAETLDLKARMGRSASLERVLGGVLLRPPATPYDTLVIDAGSAEGVALGDMVSAGGTALVGRVTEVYLHAARVALLSSPGDEYDALLHLPGRSGHVPVKVAGQGGNSLRAQVPSGVPVEVGASVVLPGVAGGLVGVVSHVERAEGDSFATLYMQLPVDVRLLRYVEVWKQTPHELR